ncbi:MBL fold metallo-hydrolase [Martelella soudanensis]|uniref:MBL fold metallo-hydrolase n=1 Tax=Martelella sp. NC20 TaxID=2740298 RepID=UPI0015DD97D9|nr:MBL fold metallo-hydrolase [Martelella sp. NC20]
MSIPEFDPAYGRAVPLAEGIARLTAKNPSPFTFHGTNGYLVGRDELIIIDPGPEIDGHLEHWLAAIGGRKVRFIAVTHTHNDHSPMARRLKAETGAPIAGFGPHRQSRPLFAGETNPFAESADMTLQPDVVLGDGDSIAVDGFALQAVHTPGHTANHLAFALQSTPYLFCGDHVMDWSTTIVAPPDGSLGDYMASIEKLLERPETVYFSGHGDIISDAKGVLRATRSHRRMREKAILERLAAGDETIAGIVEVIYRTTDARLHGAAALSVLAHLEDLVERGRVTTDGPPLLNNRYRLSA